MSAFHPELEPIPLFGARGAEGTSAIHAIVSLLLASPPEALEREALRLDAALAMVCTRLARAEKAETALKLEALRHLFPLSVGELEPSDPGASADRASGMESAPPVEIAHSGPVADLDALRFALPDNLMQVALLPHVDEATSAILVFRGTSDVIAAVTGNPGARFALSSFTTLIELAPGDRRIKENLSLRIDLPERLAMRLLPFLNDAQLVKMLAAGASIDMATAASDLSTEREVYRGSGVDPSRPLDDTIIMLCNDARISELSELLADRLAIALASTMNLLCGRLDHAAGILLHAAGASTAVVQPVLQLRQRLACRQSNDRRAAHDAFLRYSGAEARRIVLACASVLRTSGLVVSDFEFEAAPIIG